MADGIVAINRDSIRIGSRQYLPDEELEPSLLLQMRPELTGYLQPDESRAAHVARAIRKLHFDAIRDSLAE